MPNPCSRFPPARDQGTLLFRTKRQGIIARDAFERAAAGVLQCCAGSDTQAM